MINYRENKIRGYDMQTNQTPQITIDPPYLDIFDRLCLGAVIVTHITAFLIGLAIGISL